VVITVRINRVLVKHAVKMQFSTNESCRNEQATSTAEHSRGFIEAGGSCRLKNELAADPGADVVVFPIGRTDNTIGIYVVQTPVHSRRQKNR
jgi:hypothetical protein